MSSKAISRQCIRETVRAFILNEFLIGEPSDNLDDLTPLITGGIIDSIGSVRLVSHLEDRFNIVLTQEDVTVDHLDNIRRIIAVVAGKVGDVHPQPDQ